MSLVKVEQYIENCFHIITCSVTDAYFNFTPPGPTKSPSTARVLHGQSMLGQLNFTSLPVFILFLTVRLRHVGP